MDTLCEFPSYEKGTRCESCGYELKRDFTGPVNRICGLVDPEKRAALLGDRIEQYLKVIGITRENYTDAKEALAMLPECYCPERKKAFNEVHLYAKEHGWPSAIANAKKIYERILDESKKDNTV